MLPSSHGTRDNGLRGQFTLWKTMNKSVLFSVLMLIFSCSFFWFSYRHCSNYGNVSTLSCSELQCTVSSKGTGDYTIFRDDFINLEKIRVDKAGNMLSDADVRKKSSKEQRKLAYTLQLEYNWSAEAGMTRMKAPMKRIFSTEDMGKRSTDTAVSQFKRYKATTDNSDRIDDFSVSVGSNITVWGVLYFIFGILLSISTCCLGTWSEKKLTKKHS